MTRYTVVWASDVQDDFLDRWIDADSATRRRMTEIAEEIDQQLAARAPRTRLTTAVGTRVSRVGYLVGLAHQSRV